MATHVERLALHFVIFYSVLTYLSNLYLIHLQIKLCPILLSKITKQFENNEEKNITCLEATNLPNMNLLLFLTFFLLGFSFTIQLQFELLSSLFIVC